MIPNKHWKLWIAFIAIELLILVALLVWLPVYNAKSSRIESAAMQAEAAGDYDTALELYSKLHPTNVYRVAGERNIRHIRLVESGECKCGHECPCVIGRSAE